VARRLTEEAPQRAGVLAEAGAEAARFAASPD